MESLLDDNWDFTSKRIFGGEFKTYFEFFRFCNGGFMFKSRNGGFM